MEHETSFRILSCLSRTYHAYAKRDQIASRFLAFPPNLFCPSIKACRALSPSLNSIVFYHIFPQPCKRLHQKGQNLLAPYNYRPYLQLLNLHSSGLTQTTTRSRSIPALAITSNPPLLDPFPKVYRNRSCEAPFSRWQPAANRHSHYPRTYNGSTLTRYSTTLYSTLHQKGQQLRQLIGSMY